MKETVLPSGLILVEEQLPEPPKPRVEETVKCVSCDNRTKEMAPLFGHHTEEKWVIYHPTCKHASFVVCLDCEKKYPGCPVCGCGEVYC